jgi:hypothetical protein
MNSRGVSGAKELEVGALRTPQPQKHQHLQPPLRNRTENTSCPSAVPPSSRLHPTHTYFRSARPFQHSASQYRYKVQLIGAAVSVPRSMMAPRLQRTKQAAKMCMHHVFGTETRSKQKPKP